MLAPHRAGFRQPTGTETESHRDDLRRPHPRTRPSDQTQKRSRCQTSAPCCLNAQSDLLVPLPVDLNAREPFSRSNIVACVQRRATIVSCRATLKNLRAVPRGGCSERKGARFFTGPQVLSLSSPQLPACLSRCGCNRRAKAAFSAARFLNRTARIQYGGKQPPSFF